MDLEAFRKAVGEIAKGIGGQVEPLIRQWGEETIAHRTQPDQEGSECQGAKARAQGIIAELGRLPDPKVGMAIFRLSQAEKKLL
jgi:hypothetical protein